MVRHTYEYGEDITKRSLTGLVRHMTVGRPLHGTFQ